MAGRIEKRRTFTGTGMGANPESIEELEKRREQHDRLIQGKPVKPFGQHLAEKMKKLRGDADEDEEGKGKGEEQQPEEEAAAGAIEPHLGLQPNQSAELVVSGKGRRSGRVIVKG